MHSLEEITINGSKPMGENMANAINAFFAFIRKQQDLQIINETPNANS